MNRILALLPFVFSQLFFNSLNSQELWGITSEGGPYENGTVFKIDIPNGTHEIEYDFPFVEGISPKYLIESNDGNIYGTTSGFGTGVEGSIIKLNPNNYSYKSIFQFSDSLGKFPGGIFQDPLSGYIYGINAYGGQYDKGNIFKFNPYTNNYSVLFSFDYTLGAEPMGNLIPLNDSLFYGVTKSGGNSTRGVLYSFNINTNEYSVLFNFNDSLGSSRKNIMLASNGFIYGTTYFGGDYYEGVLFKYNIENGVYSKLVDFNDTIGKSIKGALVEASNGKLYGTTYGGGELYGGVLFEFDLQTETYSVKHNFEFYKGLPLWYLTELKEGELFGSTNTGGYFHCGTVFKYDIINDSLAFINDFNLNIGRGPSGWFFKFSNGKIISTTHGGGSFNSGAFFEFDIADYSMTKIYDYYGYTEFHNTMGTLLNSPEGKVYGLTRFKASTFLHTHGAFFSIEKATKEHNVLDVYSRPVNSLSNYNYEYYFYPNCGLSEYYLRAYFPDSLMSHSLFEFFQTNGTLTGEMVMADNNLLYGMQSSFSTNSFGRIISFNPRNYNYEYKSGFWGSNGAYPANNSFVNIHDGFLYGITISGGGNNSGVIFKYDTDTDEITKLYNFSYLTGSEPTGKLLHHKNGVFYGTTRVGGENDKGVLFEYSLSENKYEVKHNFDTDNGANPTGSLLKASDGKIYGMTTNGGEYIKGVVYEFDIQTQTYTKLFDFDGTNGSHPLNTSLIEVCDIPAIVNQPENIEVVEGDATFFTIVPSTGNITGIQWYRHNLPLEGATDDTLFIEQASILDQGYYYCEIYTLCSSIRSKTVYLSLVNGINSSGYFDGFSLFPNPTKGIINIETDKLSPTFDVRILDMCGRQLIDEQFESTKAARIDIGTLKNGVYFLNINSNGTGKTIKLIKY